MMCSKPDLAGIKVNGRVLIDGVSYNGIGNDGSGQGNHFTDTNFAVFHLMRFGVKSQQLLKLTLEALLIFIMVMVNKQVLQAATLR